MAESEAYVTKHKTKRNPKTKLLFNRRTALQGFAGGAVVAALPACASAPKKPTAVSPQVENFLAQFGPIDRTIVGKAADVFSGDQPEGPHAVLWDKAGFLEKHSPLPGPEETVPLVIVGGGMSGLFSAYLLRERQPIVLEQAARFGGNSKGEAWNGIDYSIGAAYFMAQDEDSDIFRLFAELGIHERCRMKTTEDPVILGQKRYDAFWTGETDPGSPQFQKLFQYLSDVNNNQGGQHYPEIPSTTSAERDVVDTLDRQSLYDNLAAVVQAPLHPHIDSAIEHYCWSTFGSSSREISAASGLNALAAEFGEVYVAPGGNAAVAEQVLRRLLETLPQQHLRTRSLVFDVIVNADHVLVGYLDGNGQIHVIRAKAAIMCCPKFVAKRTIRDLEPARLDAMAKLRYRAYVVANVLIKKVIPDDFYDLFLLGKEGEDFSQIFDAYQRQRATDVVLGTYAKVDATRSVLTLYRALPFEGGRAMLFSPAAFDQQKQELREQCESEILPLLGLTMKDVEDIRLTRWGHPMPVPAIGLIADGVTDQLRRPFKDRVFFVEQDNWMLAAIETAAEEALHFAPLVEKVLA